jgi:hypothetical protein
MPRRSGLTIRKNTAEVGRLLRSEPVRQGLVRAANDVAARVRGRASATPYTGLSVAVDSTTRGGVRGDRAQANVVIGPPPASGLRYPDTARFRALAQVAGEVSG